MAESNYRRTLGFVSGADLTAAANHFVFLSEDREVILSLEGGDAVGVLTKAVDLGQDADVMTEQGSIVEVVAGEAMDAMTPVAANAEGRAVGAAGDSTHILGLVLDASTADGDLVTLLLRYGGQISEPA